MDLLIEEFKDLGIIAYPRLPDAMSLNLRNFSHVNFQKQKTNLPKSLFTKEGLPIFPL